MFKIFSNLQGFCNYFFIGEGDNILSSYLFGDGGGAGFHSDGFKFSFGVGHGGGCFSGNGTGYGFIEGEDSGDGYVYSEGLRFDDVES